MGGWLCVDVGVGIVVCCCLLGDGRWGFWGGGALFGALCKRFWGVGVITRCFGGWGTDVILQWDIGSGEISFVLG